MPVTNTKWLPLVVKETEANFMVFYIANLRPNIVFRTAVNFFIRFLLCAVSVRLFETIQYRKQSVVSLCKSCFKRYVTYKFYFILFILLHSLQASRENLSVFVLASGLRLPLVWHAVTWTRVVHFGYVVYIVENLPRYLFNSSRWRFASVNTIYTYSRWI